MKTFSIILISCAGFLALNDACEAGGFFRRVPEVGEWARYDLVMGWKATVKDENVPAPNSGDVTGTVTIKCVGEEAIDEIRHLWIESRFDVIEADETEHWMIVKLLVPAEHVTDDDLALHVVRAWGHRDDAEDVTELNLDAETLYEDTSRFGFLLSFPSASVAVGHRENKTLTINGEELELTQSESGPIAGLELDDVQMSGEAKWWPSPDHAFGVAAVEQLIETEMREPVAISAELRIQMDLTETGSDAVSDLPDHN